MGSHMQQVDLLIPHKDTVLSHQFFCLNVSALSIVENKNSPQTSVLQWLWSS